MSTRLLQALNSFDRSIAEARKLANDAYSWSLVRPTLRGMTIGRRDVMTELAFLRAFLAWEQFIEDVFILYMYGHKPPRGRAPTRLAFPPNLEAARDWVLPEDRSYASWEDAGRVIKRSARFFKHGEPFTTPLRANQSVFKEIVKLRNAVAHRSDKSHSEFVEVVRNRIGSPPPGITVGGFLWINVRSVTPSQTHMELYLQRIESTARMIVPI